MSNLYLDIKYGRLAGSTLERMKVKKDTPLHLQSRCPICGDSATNKSKTRFHIREHGDTVFVSCFNCGYSTNLVSYLKTYNPGLYSEYCFERFRDTKQEGPVITTVETAKTASIELKSLGLINICDLPETHPASVYVNSRKLPDYQFQYVENFFKFSSKYNPELSVISKDEPRLIIPFFDRKGNIFAYQGRDLSGKSSQKYITISINKRIPKIFGLDRVDLKKPVIIVEGPIDSLFIPNAIASVNAGLLSTAKKMEAVIPKSMMTICFDNEPRNEQIVKMYHDAIHEGYNVVIWPTSPGKKEDINDLILLNKSPMDIIRKNTYCGLSAQIEFQKWKRI